MKIKEKKWIRFRIYLVAVFFLLGFLTVLARSFQLQVLEKNRLKTFARSSYEGIIKLPPKRGTIYDRKGHELAISIEVGSVYSHPKRVKNKVKTSSRLSQILKEKKSRILKLLKSKSSFVWIKRKIDPDRARKIKALGLDGIGVITEVRRCYPGREIAAHLIGFVGSENQGLEGLEKKYDNFLSGPQYSLIHMLDAKRRPFSISRPIPSGNGKMHDLILTIDKDIQYKAQQALRLAVKKTRARAGHCIVVNPDTGEILAMAVVPEFNPNIFFRYKPYQWRNRTVTDCFEPGSTIKAFLLAASLEKGVVNPNTRFDCEQGKYKIGTKTVRDTHKHGIMSVSEIIMHSSNIGAIKIGQKLGYGTFYNYLQQFGFGKKTGINLMSERKGFIRPPKDAKKIEQATLFFGQGMTTTSLQLVMAMAAIANGGKLMRPYVVKAVVDESGRVVKETGPEMVRRVISRRTAGRVANILEKVVSNEGTGAKACISGFRAAGKTGTSQKVDPKTRRYSRSKYVASFAGFVPVDRPRLVILAVIDEPRGITYGGIVAGPVFSDVGSWCLNYLRVDPQLRLVEKGVNQGETERSNIQKTVVCRPAPRVKGGALPDFRGLGMRDVLKRGRSLGLTVLLKGTGLAYKQDPRPGSSIKKTTMVKVCFRPPT